MELLEIVLLLLGAVLASSVLDQMMPRVSLPLVQIALGAAIAALWAGPLDLEVDPELFLVLFIAPLLFDESRRASKKDLWNSKGGIVSLAVGLVLAIVLVVGFALHWLVPSVPLAAAFALGAALGPTDAVAVSSLSKDVRLSTRQETLLSGEALLNDASGVVSFQFAVAAAVTGAFSLEQAGSAFAVSFVGGLALGVVLGLAFRLVIKAIRSRGFESTTVHVVFEVFTPFIVYLVAEAAGVSGILAVVAAGLLATLFPPKASPAAARLGIASSSVWDVLTFVLNGVVFVLLGMQLPRAILPTWDGGALGLPQLLGCVLVLTVLVEGVRFVWLLVMEAVHAHSGGEGGWRLSKAQVRDVLVTTLSGPKGAVTLSIAFTIPLMAGDGPFPERDLLIFLASGVILCTLLLANFVVPLLAPARDAAAGDELRDASLAVLRNVVAELDARADANGLVPTRVVMSRYVERIERLDDGAERAERMAELRAEVLERQKGYVVWAMGTGQVGQRAGEGALDRLERARSLLARQRKAGKASASAHGRRRSAALVARHAFGRRRGGSAAGEREEERILAENLAACAADYLRTRQGDADEAVADAARLLLAELEHRRRPDADGPGDALPAGLVPPSREGREGLLRRVADVEAEGLRLELEQIQSLRERGEISRETARDLREEVYLMQLGLNAA
ncbi:cation:proton antiporter [Gordonibacter massiliensis (ex Traore et al. 2017)]|uniref:Sodium:proton antiporter n=1 Tax=Gordonibacter massiliensis (ex Traore et al. 2017) TaxID=1841863 RepID=A0A842JEW8_9ACTN|nr:sodium:proton antiporter [Gordonibacter massiliensis (ex Traore et al. 2017)]MBC2890553.1 sodium:proton antiporter [Gordonibacter massiliensis (ex Traore et al. 2017)]